MEARQRDRTDDAGGRCVGRHRCNAVESNLLRAGEEVGGDVSVVADVRACKTWNRDDPKVGRVQGVVVVAVTCLGEGERVGHRIRRVEAIARHRESARADVCALIRPSGDVAEDTPGNADVGVRGQVCRVVVDILGVADVGVVDEVRNIRPLIQVVRRAVEQRSVVRSVVGPALDVGAVGVDDVGRVPIGRAVGQPDVVLDRREELEGRRRGTERGGGLIRQEGLYAIGDRVTLPKHGAADGTAEGDC